MPGYVREIDLTALSGDLHMSYDPLSAEVPPPIVFPPADGVEVIKGAGVLVIENEGVEVTLGALAPLEVGWSCSGLSITKIVQTGTTVQAIRVRWVVPT